MRGKKIFGVLGLFFLATLLMLNLASAAFRDSLDTALSGAGDATKFILGDFGENPEGELFLVKFLVFIILLVLVYKAAEKFPPLKNQRGVLVIISIVVSILAVRYITSEQVVNFIWLPYGVLGVTFATLFPFLLAFFLVKDWDSGVARKVVWAGFFVIFAGLAYLRWPDFATAGATFLPTDFVGPPGPGESYAPWWMNLGMLYVLIAVLSLLMILFDRSLRAIMLHSELRSVDDRDKKVQVGAIHNRISKLRRQLSETDPTNTTAITALESSIAALNTQIDHLMKRT